MATQSHESLTSFRAVKASSSRRFGVTVGLILCALSLWPLVKHHPVRLWLLAIGSVLLVLGVVAPRLLDPVNALWFKLGLLLAKVTNPVVMGAMYVLAVVPIAWLIRRRGYDLMRLRARPDADTYWIERDTTPGSLAKQF